MTSLIQEYMTRCSRLLETDDGRYHAAQLLEWYLQQSAFLTECQIAYYERGPRVYTDPDTGLTLAPYPYKGPQVRRPHDHCGSWEIYGQAEGVTLMIEGEVVALPTATTPALCQPVTCRTLQAGQTLIAGEEVIHAPWRPGDGMIVRVEGESFHKKRRMAYDWL